MENWGLMTFKVTNMLVVPKSTTTKVEMDVARVIAHELCLFFFIFRKRN